MRQILILGLVALVGCTYNVAQQTDRAIQDMARRSFDRDPPAASTPASAPSAAEAPAEPTSNFPKVDKDIQTANYLEQAPKEKVEQPFKLEIPPALPGSEIPAVRPKNKEELKELIAKLYPPLPALPDEPRPVMRATGKPYTLAEFQELAALNSPTLKQAAADLKSAEGALVQAKTYGNPTMGYRFDPSNDGETAGVHGVYLGQKIPTAGKRRLAIAAAQKDFDNAELALRRARSDLATQVRTAYFALLVAKETIRVNRALSVLTDEIYRAQVNLLQKGGIAAGYEPAPLRAQAYAARLALKQSITSYLYSWKQLVTAVGLQQLPLSEVSGRIDVNIPFFDYDTVLTYVLKNHTDIRTAYNGIEKARYNTRLAQITPWFSDIDFALSVEKEFSLQPFQWFAAGQVNFAVPVWDRNRGNIISAEAALIRASEQVRVAELNLSNNLQSAYILYKNNLDALEYYRRYILPDQVQAYRGVLERRQIDPNAQFGDLVQSQQSLATNVATYLGILGQLWTSAITVADYLQTDDLFALADPMAVPSLPTLDQLGPLPGCQPVPPLPPSANIPRKPEAAVPAPSSTDIATRTQPPLATIVAAAPAAAVPAGDRGVPASPAPQPQSRGDVLFQRSDPKLE